MPRINIRTPEEQTRIIEKAEKEIMKNERRWNTTRIYNILIKALVDADLPNYYHNHQLLKQTDPEQYSRLVSLIKGKHSKFIKEMMSPLINIQLSLGEDYASENDMEDEMIIGDSNTLLCNMILGGRLHSSSRCEQYDIMTSVYKDNEDRFQDLDDDDEAYDREEIPRTFVNLKNMMYYECVDCNKEIYSQPNRTVREECKCCECYENS